MRKPRAAVSVVLDAFVARSFGEIECMLEHHKTACDGSIFYSSQYQIPKRTDSKAAIIGNTFVKSEHIVVETSNRDTKIFIVPHVFKPFVVLLA